MKFCYADESGHHAEVVVLAGVVVDVIRMPRTKAEWNEMLRGFAARYEKPLSEFKARELHRGKGFWSGLDGPERKAIVREILEWMKKRKHAVTFGAVSTTRLADHRSHDPVPGFEKVTPWSIAATHLVLSVQKAHQKQKHNKGNTVFVFDHAQEYRELQRLIIDPPAVTDGFYRVDNSTPRLDQIVDVPYFADSQHAGLIQVADFCAYILRLYAELMEGRMSEGFVGETSQLSEWMEMMRPVLMPDAVRWPKRTKDSYATFVRSIAPPSLLSVAS